MGNEFKNIDGIIVKGLIEEAVRIKPNLKIGVVYHEDMDGVIGAVCIKSFLKLLGGETEFGTEYIPTQYGKDKILNFDKMENFDILLFIDFCPSVSELEQLFTLNDRIFIFDHHKTQIDKIKENLKTDFSLTKKYGKRFGYYFNKNKAGCGIAYDEFVCEKSWHESSIKKLSFVSNYAEDMDLWKWELDNSKKINAGLDIFSTTLDLKHNPEEWYQILIKGKYPDNINILQEEYPEINFIKIHTTFGFIDIIQNLGVSKIRYDNKYVKKIVSFAQKGTLPKINIGGIEMFVFNNSNLISEVGNALTTLDYPSCQYFIVQNIKDGLIKEPEVVLSFRSTDDLPDVSMVAKALGGGGHRNACGATIALMDLSDLLMGRL